MVLPIGDWPNQKPSSETRVMDRDTAHAKAIQKENNMETPDGIGKVDGLDNSASWMAAQHRAAPPLDYDGKLPSVGLTAKQEIRLACLKLIYEYEVGAIQIGSRPHTAAELRASVENTGAYVTTGNWPDDIDGPTD